MVHWHYNYIDYKITKFCKKNNKFVDEIWIYFSFIFVENNNNNINNAIDNELYYIGREFMMTLSPVTKTTQFQRNGRCIDGKTFGS